MSFWRETHGIYSLLPLTALSLGHCDLDELSLASLAFRDGHSPPASLGPRPCPQGLLSNLSVALVLFSTSSLELVFWEAFLFEKIIF